MNVLFPFLWAARRLVPFAGLSRTISPPPSVAMPVLLALWGLSSGAARAGQMTEDFEDGHFDEQTWTINVPSPAEGRATLESAGLHITIPPRAAGKGSVSVKSRIPLRGDFTITAVYSLKSLAIPATGFVNCQLMASSTTDGPMAAIRQSHDKLGLGFSLWHEPPKGDAKRKGNWKFNPAANNDESRAALRLRRRGSKVDVSYRLIEGDIFATVGEFEYGTSPIANWEYLVMSPFATTTPTDVILHRLEVDAEGLDIPEFVKTGPKRESWLPSVILFSAAAVAIAVVLWQVLARWKRK